MRKEEITEKINKVFSNVLGHNYFSLTTETSADDVDGWESITHMMIITEIENTFNIKFKLMDLMNMNNIGDLITTIEKEIKS